MTVEFWAALMGALVGGLATLGGSVIVNRREVRRGARLRLHDHLLPELEAAIDREKPMRIIGMIDRGDRVYSEPPPIFVEVIEAVRRAAALAGRHAKGYVPLINDAFEDYVAAAKRVVIGQYNPDTLEYEGGSGKEEQLDARSELVSRIREFSDWIENKIL